MIIETGLIIAIATVLAFVAFLVKELDWGNEKAFRALNFLAAALFAIAFFFENAKVAMAVAIVWAIVAVISILRGNKSSEAPLRGWDDEFFPRGSKKPIKKKHKQREKKTAEKKGEEQTNTVWPWS